MRRRVVILLLLACVVSIRAASAEPLHVTSGVFLLDIEGDLFTLAGQGFEITTIGPHRGPVQPDGLGIYSTKRFPGHCRSAGVFSSCPEGEGGLVDWSFETIGGDQLLGRGNVTLDGMSATNVDFFGSMRFDAVPTPLSSGGTTDFDFVGPFSFEAMIRGVQDGEELFARRFTGSGRLSANYEQGTHPPGVFGLHDDTIPYVFEAAAPIPEPGTLLLLGAGLSASLLWRRRRREIDDAVQRGAGVRES